MRSFRSDLLISVVLALTTLAVFSRACTNGFVYDDVEYVTENPHVHGGLTGENIHWAFTTTHSANWHPLTWLSLQLDSQLYGPDRPWGFHLTNLVLHAANTMLLFLVLRRMTGAVGRSFFVAAFFAVHPLHVESVAWVSERKDVLSTLFWMLTLAAYLRYAARPGVARYLPVVVLFALGLMAKPMLVTLPLVLLLLDYWPLGRFHPGRQVAPVPATSHEGGPPTHPPAPFWRLFWEKVPLFLLVTASCAVTLFAQRQGGALKTAEWLPLELRLSNALVAYVAYLGKTFWPGGLAVFYPHPRHSLPLWKILGAGLLLFLMTLLAIRSARQRPYLAVGWFWYLGTLVPVIGLVQVGEQALADRYTYVPLIGVFLMLSWGLADLAAGWRKPERVLVPTAAGVLLLACMLCTWMQLGYWQNEEVLWKHALAVTSGNYIAHHKLGFPLLQQRKYEEAKQHYEAALAINPEDANAHHYLGLILVQQGEYEGAKQRFAEAARLDPDLQEARHNLEQVHLLLGAACTARQQWSAAVSHYTQALAINPGNAQTWNQLGTVYARQGQREQAIDCYRRAVDLEPGEEQFRRNLDRAVQEHHAPCLPGPRTVPQ